MSLVLNSNPQLTASEIRAIVVEARMLERDEGNPIKTPETERIVRYWQEHRPLMFKRLSSVTKDAPLCLASRLWDRAHKQAKEAAGVNQFPTYQEAMEVASRDLLLMEPEKPESQENDAVEAPLDPT